RLLVLQLDARREHDGGAEPVVRAQVDGAAAGFRVREVGVGAGGVGLVVLRVAGAGLEVAQREEQPELEAVGQAPGGLEAEGQPVLELVRVPVDDLAARIRRVVELAAPVADRERRVRAGRRRSVRRRAGSKPGVSRSSSWYGFLSTTSPPECVG